MKLVTIFFYVVAAFYVYLFLAFFDDVPSSFLEGLAIIIIPALTIFNPLIALAGFIYAYSNQEWTLLAWYTACVVIPVSITSSLWLWNA